MIKLFFSPLYNTLSFHSSSHRAFLPMHNWYLPWIYLLFSPLSSSSSPNPPLFGTFLLAAGVFALEILLQVAKGTGMFIGARMVAVRWEHTWKRAIIMMSVIMMNLQLDGRHPLNEKFFVQIDSADLCALNGGWVESACGVSHSDCWEFSSDQNGVMLHLLPTQDTCQIISTKTFTLLTGESLIMNDYSHLMIEIRGGWYHRIWFQSDTK